MNEHGQIDIMLGIFPSSERSVSYFLMRSDDDHNMIHDLLRPIVWHHLCIGIDGESNTVYSTLVINKYAINISLHGF